MVEKERIWELRFEFLRFASNMPEVRKADLCVLGYLVATYNVREDKSWPGIDTMASAVSMGRSQVLRSIRQLIGLRLLTLVSKEGPGKYVYRPAFERVTLPTRQSKSSEPRW